MEDPQQMYSTNNYSYSNRTVLQRQVEFRQFLSNDFAKELTKRGLREQS